MNDIINKNVNLYTYIITSHTPAYHTFYNTNQTINICNIINNMLTHMSDLYIDKIFSPLNYDVDCTRGIFLLCKKNNKEIILNTHIPFIYGNNKKYYDINNGTIYKQNILKQTDRHQLIKKYKDIFINNKIDIDLLTIFKILFNGQSIIDKEYITYYEKYLDKINDMFYKYIQYTDLSNLMDYIIKKHNIINIDMNILNFQYYTYRKYVAMVTIIADDNKIPENITYKIYNSIDDFFEKKHDDKTYKIISNNKYILVEEYDVIQNNNIQNDDEYIYDNEIETQYYIDKEYKNKLNMLYDIEKSKNKYKL